MLVTTLVEKRWEVLVDCARSMSWMQFWPYFPKRLLSTFNDYPIMICWLFYVQSMFSFIYTIILWHSSFNILLQVCPGNRLMYPCVVVITLFFFTKKIKLLLFLYMFLFKLSCTVHASLNQWSVHLIMGPYSWVQHNFLTIELWISLKLINFLILAK